MLKRKHIKKFYFVVAVLCFSSLILFACSQSSQNSNNKKESTDVAKIDWSFYDNKMQEIKTCSDFEKRVSLMHEAEDFLMDSGLVIPIYNPTRQYLAKEELKNYYTCVVGDGHYETAYIEGKNTVNLQVMAEPTTLAVNTEATDNSFILSHFINATLTKLSEDGLPVPYAAKSIDVSDDKLIYTFHLRDNLKWSDGSELNADDFIYSFNWGADINNTCAYREFFSYIEGFPDNLNIKASKNKKTLIVKLKNPCPYFLEITSTPIYMPLNKKDIERFGTNDPKAWGQKEDHLYSGPYIVSKWQHRESIELTKNPYFFDADNIKSEKINLMLSADSAVIMNAYKAGDIDLATNIPISIMTEYKNSKEFHTYPVLGYTGITINSKSKIFKGMTVEQAKTFRKALNYVIDRDFIIALAAHNSGIVLNSIVPEKTMDGNGKLFKNNSEHYTYPYEKTGYFDTKKDLDKARKMLESIGFKFNNNGKLKNAINIEYLFNPASTNNSIAECLQQDFSEIGINLILRSVEFNQFLDARKKGESDFSRGGWLMDYNDPYSILETFISTNSNCEINVK